jgi:hypothetical protein
MGKKDPAKLKEQAAVIADLQRKSGSTVQVSKSTNPISINSIAIKKEQKAAADELKKKEEGARIKSRKR